ncbi:MAG: carbon-nitrogen hydrolase family protein [Deltaproteobacteria bacterium]|nr:carbon-nitrogen hydrolase family protein [Deltaproteobacteria bacterium]
MACTIAALEVPHRHGQVQGQLAWIDAQLALMHKLAPAPIDLVVLPELSLTGYVSARGDFELRAYAEPLEGPTLTALKALARKHGHAIAGPLVEKRAAQLAHNACVVVDREGRLVAHYRKRHPWFPERWATPGLDLPPVFTLGEVTLTLAICFDVNFLEQDAREQLEAAEVLLFPSAWCEVDEDQRDVLLPALAHEHELTVVNANWGEGTPQVPGQGASRIVGPDGHELARVHPDEPAWITCVVEASR